MSDYKDDKHFEEEFQALLPISARVSELLDELFNPSSSNLSKGSIAENHEKFIPQVFVMSLCLVYGNLVMLAENSQHHVVAILSRPILECMANIGWLFDSFDDKTEFSKRTRLLVNQGEKVDDLVRGVSDRVPTMSNLGAGSIMQRLEARGAGWARVYSHLSSFSHMDAGYAVHYVVGEAGGVRNICMLFTTAAAIESGDMLIDMLPLKLKTRRKLRGDLKEIKQELDTLYPRMLEVVTTK